MPHLWLLVAVVLYGMGLVYALVALSRKRDLLARFLVPLTGLGIIFHFVSLVEGAAARSQLAPASFDQTASLLAFVLMVFFMGIFLRYRTTYLSIFALPLVFLLGLVAYSAPDLQFTGTSLRSGWIFVHIALIFLGYAALIVSFGASILYLVQERSLKSKQLGTAASRLPALEVVDDIGYRSLLIGFPVMTLGLVVGAAIAQAHFGPGYFHDPKVALSVVMWLIYLVLLLARWSSGWRGRKAAYLATFAFVVAIGVWAANYLSAVHRYVAP